MEKVIFIASIFFSLGLLSNASVAKEVIVCFPSGQCIDINDPGRFP